MKINISTNIYMKINRLCALYDWSVFDSRAQCVQLFQNKWKRCLIYIDRFEFPSVSAKYIRPTAAVVGWWQQLRLRSTLNIQCPQTIFFFYITSLHSRHTRKRHARRCIKSTFIFVMCIWRWQGIVAANIGLHINLIVDRMWCSGVDPCNNVPSYTAFNASHRTYDYESFIIVIVGWRQQTSCVFLSSFKHIKRLIMNRFFVFFFLSTIQIVAIWMKDEVVLGREMEKVQPEITASFQRQQRRRRHIIITVNRFVIMMYTLLETTHMPKHRLTNSIGHHITPHRPSAISSRAHPTIH